MQQTLSNAHTSSNIANTYFIEKFEMVKITALHDVKYNKREVHIELSTSFGSDMIMFLLQRETIIVQALPCSVGSLAF